MLVLTRHIGQEIVIGNDIRILLLEVRGEQARIGVSAPPHIRVDRLEVKMRRDASKEKDNGAGSVGGNVDNSSSGRSSQPVSASAVQHTSNAGKRN